MAEDAAGKATIAIAEYRNLFGARVQSPVDMDAAALRHAIETARAALAECGDWQSKGDAVVARIKEEFDSKYGPSWHCIIGKHFGSKVTHAARQFCFFYLNVRVAGRQ